MTTRLFETAKHAQIYSKFRPRYGMDVFETIFNFCKTGKCDFNLAVDVGCGSGQSTIPLASRFASVIGTDISENQIKSAPKNNNKVQFRTGSAEDLSYFSNNSVDLLTISQALHWLDTKKFYAEVTRVLKPGASLVAYGYGLNVFDNKKAEGEINQFYNGTIGQYWNKQRHDVEKHLIDYTLPFPGWIRNDELTIDVEWTVDEFIGYVSSWSGYQSYQKANPTSDELNKLSNRIKSLYTENSIEKKMKISWPVFMLMGHKPQE